MPGVNSVRLYSSDRRADAGGIRHLVRVRHGAPIRRSRRSAGNVARTDHQGESKFVRAGFILQQLDHGKRDPDLAVGRNIRHRLGKDIGALLVQQRRGMARVTRRFVDLVRFFALFDHGLDLAVAHLHGHAVHRAVMGQGKDIDRFHGVRQDIFKLLRYFRAGNKAADLRLDARMLEWDKSGYLSVFADDFQLPVVRCGLSGRSALRPKSDKDI